MEIAFQSNQPFCIDFIIPPFAIKEENLCFQLFAVRVFNSQQLGLAFTNLHLTVREKSEFLNEIPKIQLSPAVYLCIVQIVAQPFVHFVILAIIVFLFYCYDVGIENADVCILCNCASIICFLSISHVK